MGDTALEMKPLKSKIEQVSKVKTKKNSNLPTCVQSGITRTVQRLFRASLSLVFGERGAVLMN